MADGKAPPALSSSLVNDRNNEIALWTYGLGYLDSKWVTGLEQQAQQIWHVAWYAHLAAFSGDGYRMGYVLEK